MRLKTYSRLQVGEVQIIVRAWQCHAPTYVPHLPEIRCIIQVAEEAEEEGTQVFSIFFDPVIITNQPDMILFPCSQPGGLGMYSHRLHLIQPLEAEPPKMGSQPQRTEPVNHHSL